jgi:hypothetical protein
MAAPAQATEYGLSDYLDSSVAAAIARRWRSIIERAPSALAIG